MSDIKRSILILSMLVISFFIISSCVTQAHGQNRGPGTLRTLDDALKEAGQLDPEAGFGGLFLDPLDNSIAYAYMLDTKKQGAAEMAVKHILGQERFRSEIRKVNVLQGQYSILQLTEWYQPIKMTRHFPGLQTTDLNEGRNRIRIGVLNDGAKNRAELLVRNLGIPSEAAIVELEERLIPLNHNLISKFRSAEGGIQGGNQVQSFFKGGCTQGFNTSRSGVLGMVTNSHCSTFEWVQDGGAFYQPDNSTEANRIGVESADYGGFEGGACPTGRLCRYSDSNFVTLDGGIPATLGRIAKTNGPNSAIINHDSPYFRIVAEGSFPVQGEQLRKIGKASGWTRWSGK